MARPILEKVGLTRKEAEIYEVLLRLGESPIADVIKDTKTHPQIIYATIESLIEKGLAMVSYRRHRKYVRAESPHVLKKMEEEKLKELNQVIPDLLALQKMSSDAVIRILRGNEAIRNIRARAIEELPTGEAYYIIGSSGDRFYEIMADNYAEQERKRIKKGIIKKLISFESQKALIKKNDKFTKLAEYGYLPVNYPIVATTIIFNNTVAIQIWSADPIVITIESPEVAESYKHYFETLWRVTQ